MPLHRRPARYSSAWQRPVEDVAAWSPRDGIWVVRDFREYLGVLPLRRVLAVIAAAIAVTAGLYLPGVLRAGTAVAACPAGFHRLGGGDPDARPAGDPDAQPRGSRGGAGPCWRNGLPLPETLMDLAQTNGAQVAAMGLSSPTAMAGAATQAAALANSTVAKSGGTWSVVGNGHMQTTDGSYMASGYATTQESGRLTGYALGPNGTVYAGAANGGVWKSTDQGTSWTDISLSLPTQIVGGVGWSSAGGPLGTILALTGDNSFGQYNWSGIGLYYSTDEGAHWVHASGIPDGALGFKVAVDPGTPTTVYAATGIGLFRSIDAGQTWANVDLPTVDTTCWTVPTAYTEKCALATVVTDVAVRGADKFGHPDGAVVAAVGWRAGNAKSADGTVQAPSNGLYESPDGTPGSFAKLADGSGFPNSANVGRVSLGDAYGPNQNHNYLYALVQDAQLMQDGGISTGTEGALDQIGLSGTVSGKLGTYVNGAYVSADFGKTWTQIANTTDFIQPATGSALVPLLALGVGPGVQSWYNNWIQPDPYAADPVLGAPTNLLLGMEEIWQTATPGTPQIGKEPLHVVAPYAGGTYVCVITGSPCGTAVQAAGVSTTHPDQHGVLFLPPPSNPLVSRQILTTSDGGNYTAAVPLVGSFTQNAFIAHQDGFNTLLPYSFGVSGDGTVIAGLQDNGDIVVHQGAGTADETYPGDGGPVVIDPSNSNVAVHSLAIGTELFLNVNGGKDTNTITATNITPPFTAKYSFPQLRMDYAKPTRLIFGTRQVFIADAPMAQLTQSSWQNVFDLGSGNVASANDIYNGTAYVGYCSSCETLVSKGVFSSGIATNYGGTWHIATATGLPHRIVNAVLVDHTNPAVVYVGLGGSTKRQAFQPGLTGADGVDASGGYLYKSTDGGQTFTDITGALPQIGVTALQQVGGQLLVGDVLGAFISSDLNGTAYGQLGTGLPATTVNQFQLRPGTTNDLYVSSYGRGVYHILMTNPVRPVTLVERASAPQIHFGQPETLTVTAADSLTGTPLANESVTLQQQTLTGWADVATLSTDANGVATWTYNARATGTYRWYAATNVTPNVTYTAATGAPFTVTVSVTAED